ncbi:TauD/TfdA family dioxygenase [Pseudovibrio sp. Tun.PSC04-5.I4]|uniref:TauD/TfdA dioxygenase family protein n=1 Tax=Pseudovibrio sp. Tun.PSC04-5.I4 TaxID=1798213 RepID=UPI00088536DF|nr:TauD/TfdA family dioxygenase [Pseudovibrio sp. Tun.PSC04-5.I4]SDQ31420.1 taurine dioxygenase [Pseudovibrio sp. Tun.PSC04-5.I4]
MHQDALEAIKKIAAEPREPYRYLKVDRITPVIGAEISGVDLSQEIGSKQFEEICRAFLENHVLVFRGQDITKYQQKAFGRRFGTLRSLPLSDIDGDDPEIVLIRAGKKSTFVAGEVWHTDGTSDPAPSMGSMLYMHETPEIGCGGDTLFANMHLAYETLSPTMKEFLKGLTAIHDGAVPWKGFTPPEGLPKTEHPIVAKHPDTGRSMLFVNSGFTTHIPSLSEDESDAILNMLFNFIEREQALNCRIRWEPGTLVFWDNRCTQHRAVWDYYPYSRFGERVTVLGSKPEGALTLSASQKEDSAYSSPLPA